MGKFEKSSFEMGLELIAKFFLMLQAIIVDVLQSGQQ